jgi:hypothetical protein
VPRVDKQKRASADCIHGSHCIWLHRLDRIGIDTAPAAMDIDDILREVDPTFHAIPQEQRDLQELTRAWIAERSAPELLPYGPCH